MPERNTGITADNHIELRIGINLGDVIVAGDDLYGDGVNIAARIEALADAGGVLTGRGADMILIDDPSKPEEAVSDARRNATNE